MQVVACPHHTWQQVVWPLQPSWALVLLAPSLIRQLPPHPRALAALHPSHQGVGSAPSHTSLEGSQLHRQIELLKAFVCTVPCQFLTVASKMHVVMCLQHMGPDAGIARLSSERMHQKYDKMLNMAWHGFVAKAFRSTESCTSML